MRIPITTVPKDWVATAETFEDLLEIVLWSLQCLAVGRMPDARHDRAEWEASDTWRAKRQGEDIGVKAVLVEVRGDWLMLNPKFQCRLPKFKLKAPDHGIRQGGVREQLSAGRKEQINATLVRLMKRSGTMQPAALVAETSEHLAKWFRVAARDVKRQIEGLVDRGYMEWPKADRTLLKYKKISTK